MFNVVCESQEECISLGGRIPFDLECCGEEVYSVVLDHPSSLSQTHQAYSGIWTKGWHPKNLKEYAGA